MTAARSTNQVNLQIEIIKLLGFYIATSRVNKHVDGVSAIVSEIENEKITHILQLLFYVIYNIDFITNAGNKTKMLEHIKYKLYREEKFRPGRTPGFFRNALEEIHELIDTHMVNNPTKKFFCYHQHDAEHMNEIGFTLKTAQPFLALAKYIDVTSPFMKSETFKRKSKIVLRAMKILFSERTDACEKADKLNKLLEADMQFSKSIHYSFFHNPYRHGGIRTHLFNIITVLNPKNQNLEEKPQALNEKTPLLRIN